MTKDLDWYKVLEHDELAEGRVKTVTAGHDQICMTRFEGAYSALCNACPHQGGPLGEGSIENGMLRCPWHGWDFHPATGKPPGGYDDGVGTYSVDVREDGIYVGVKSEKPHIDNVSDIMVKTMVNWGVTHVFGMVGHSNLGLADAMRIQEEEGNLTYIGIRHEGAAAFAASAFGKLTGKPAACFAIAGPGATNLLTGLWDAKVDRSPILALTGQVDAQVLGTGAFQEIDQTSAFDAVAAWSQTVLHTSRHAELMTQALKHATIERDVAHLIFPDEVQVQEVSEGAEPSDSEGRVPRLDFAPPAEVLDEAISMIEKAERPTIIVGHGARFHMDSIRELAERLKCAVLTTFKAKGQISDFHPLGCGVLGRSGTPIASWFMNESDLLVVFGASFSNHTGITPKKPIIQVDFDPLAIGKFHPVALPVLGDVGVTATAILKGLVNPVAVDRTEEIATRRKIWQEEKASRRLDDLGNGINSAAIFEAMTKVVPDNAVIAVDVGNNTYAFGRYFECKNQSVLMSGYLGSIGFGFPAAMGAWAAAPERPTICVTGDGGFGQYMTELTTAVKYKMNITHVLLHNGELGKISKEQRAGKWDVWQTSLVNPNFAEYAENCGALGIRVTEINELEDSIRRGIEHDGPALIEVMSDALLV